MIEMDYEPTAEQIAECCVEILKQREIQRLQDLANNKRKTWSEGFFIIEEIRICEIEGLTIEDEIDLEREGRFPNLGRWQ